MIKDTRGFGKLLLTGEEVKAFREETKNSRFFINGEEYNTYYHTGINWDDNLGSHYVNINLGSALGRAQKKVANKLDIGVWLLSEKSMVKNALR